MVFHNAVIERPSLIERSSVTPGFFDFPRNTILAEPIVHVDLNSAWFQVLINDKTRRSLFQRKLDG